MKIRILCLIFGSLLVPSAFAIRDDVPHDYTSVPPNSANTDQGGATNSEFNWILKCVQNSVPDRFGPVYPAMIQTLSGGKYAATNYPGKSGGTQTATLNQAISKCQTDYKESAIKPSVDENSTPADAGG